MSEQSPNPFAPPPGPSAPGSTPTDGASAFPASASEASNGFPPSYSPPSPTDGVAVAALVTGIVGLVLLPLVGIAGVVCGVIGLRRTRRDGTQGSGFAIAGLVTGGLGVLRDIALVMFFAVFIGLGVSGAFDELVTEATNSSTYGDDAALDVLWDACAEGDGQACDDLYDQAPVGSRYEEFGETCGDRVEYASYCVEEDLG